MTARRGHATAAAVATVALAGATLSIGAFVFPNAIRAESKPAAVTADETPRLAHHARSLEALRLLFEQSHAIAAHHPAAAGQPERIVLWYADADADGRAALGELLILTHHETTGTLAAATWDGALVGSAAEDGLDLIDPALLADPGFAKRWAFRTDVRSRVIVTDLAAFAVEPQGGGPNGSWRVRLVWRSDQADAPDAGGLGPDRGSITVPLESMNPDQLQRGHDRRPGDER